MIWKKLLSSFAITIIVAVVCSLFLLNFNFNFFYSLLFFTLLQFVGFYFYGEYIKQRNNRLKVEAELKALEELSKITMPVVCPCDKRIKTDLPVNLNGENEYVCEGCNKKVAVFIEAKTAVMTEPMNTTSLEDPAFIKNIEKIIKENKNDI